MSFWFGFTKTAKLKPEVELQPHQSRAIGKVTQKGGLLVYHGLGSGKTLLSIGATQGKKTDVVVPASLRGNYKKEVSQYTTEHHPKVMSFEEALKGNLRSDAEALVIDEAHNLGRQESKRSKELVEAAARYPSRILLTGTPIRNNPAEIAPLLRAVRGDKEIPVDPKTFNERFIQEKTIYPGFFSRVFSNAKASTTYEIKNKKLFRNLVDGFVDYHQPSQKDFPSVSTEVVEAPMSKEQMNYYHFVLGKASPGLRWKIKNGLPPSKTEAKQLNAFLTGVRQVSNSTKAFGGTEDSSKMKLAVEKLKEWNDKDKNFKGLVYSNYLDSGIHAYAKQLDSTGIPYGLFHGGLNDKEKKTMVDSYNDNKIKVLLVSGAGSQGLDLKGTKLVQLLEPHWNNPRLEQAMGRAIRYKSHTHLPEAERKVHVQRFLSTLPQTFMQKLVGKEADKGVDEYLDMLSKDKERLNNQFLDVLKEVGGHPKN